ncbi:MAG: T9SS type A sorting domain-containing protein [Rhodothermales bacterium]
MLFRILSIAAAGLFLSATAYAQQTGEYRSAATGNWNDASTWERFSGEAWAVSFNPPTGIERITISGEDSVSVNVAVSILGMLRVAESGVLTVSTGSLEFADGSTYEHARDGGTLPIAEWGEGSTFLLTGTVQDAPGNRNQDFHHLTINTPDLGRNRDLSLDGVTLGGDVRVVSTGANRWQLTSASGGGSATFTILGDVIVEDGQFAVQGTGNALTTFEVHHFGDIIVTGGNFSAARGSQGSGSGTTTWYLYGGDFSMSDAAIQNSNPTPGNAAFVFAGSGTQQLTFENVEYAGGRIHFEVSDSTSLEITEDFEVNGQIVNRGEILPLGELSFGDGAVYEHARNAGAVPVADWQEGSTALFSGITTDAPANRGQDYHHLILNTPDLITSRDLNLTGHTIGGDLSVLSSGSARWRLVGGSSGSVTLMGDLIVRDASFETQGTGSATDVEVHHFGNVDVDGGNFSVSRGSQGGGTGTTTWFLYDGDFSMSNARTQNSNPTPGNAKFVFAEGGLQHLTLGEGNTIDNLSIEVSDSTTLDLGSSEISGNGVFILKDAATVSTSHPNGLEGNLQTTGIVVLGSGTNVSFSGTDPQVLGTLLPDMLGTLTISNSGGVTVFDSTFVALLQVTEGGVLVVDSTGSLVVGGGSVQGTVVNRGELVAWEALEFGSSGVYEHAQNAGYIPSGTWSEGSTVLITGVTDEAPDNSNQSFHHLVFNTPDLSSNRHMGLNNVTIGGDVTVLNTGSARWYLTSASGGESATLTIMGDVIVEDGQFSVQGTGNALTTFEVYHYGNIEVTGGNFSISRGSQGSSGTTTWFLYEGDFSMANARTQNSNKGNAKFVFAGEGVQNLMLGEGNQIDNLPIEVSSGATLDIGSSELTGADLFTLSSGATLATAHEEGVAGGIQTTGEVTLDAEANFTFNGSTPQVTSALMPATVNDVVIDNEAGVTLSQPTTINGVLRLVSGAFDNTIPFTLGAGASISREGGSLVVTTSSEDVADVPAEFQLHQNYPNPFNPSTVIRYDIKESSHVTVKIFDATGREVMELVNRDQVPGSYQVEWSARGHSSGVYFYQIRAGNWSATRTLHLVK